MREDTQGDQKDDESRDPAPELVGVNDLVTEEGDEKGANGNNDNASPARDVLVHSVNKLSADNGVDG